MTIELSAHARARLQQRGIDEPVIECLLAYGRKVHDHHGSEIVFFDHQSRKQLRRNFDSATYKQIEGKLDAYVVVGRDGVVITVGHRTRRINRC